MTGAWLWTVLQPDAPLPVTRFSSPFEVGQEPLTGFGFIRSTPDGSAIVYNGRSGNLWVRRWDDLEASPVRGTEGGGSAALSPDGREVAVVGVGQAPRVVPLDGGPPRTLADVVTLAWTWGDDGFVYVTTPGPQMGIGRIAASGEGGLEVLTERLEGEFSHGELVLLPGGSKAVFQVLRAIDGSDAEIWSLDLASGERSYLTPGVSPRYAPTGHLLFGHDGVLSAAPIDAATAELTGPVIPLEEGLLSSALGNVTYDVSATGTLIFEAGGAVGGGLMEIVRVSRSGVESPVAPGWSYNPPPTVVPSFKLSSAGDRIAVAVHENENTDVWVKQLPDGPFSRLTSDDLPEHHPVWSPDETVITYFRRDAPGAGALWGQRADGTGVPELVMDGPGHQARWSPDGEWLVFRTGSVLAGPEDMDVYGFRPGVDDEPVPLVATDRFRELDPVISPDGRWLSYTSDETGQVEVYVRPFPEVDGPKIQVSTNGGFGAVWAHSGGEIFFIDGERALVAAQVSTDPQFRVLRSESLFPVRLRLGADAGTAFIEVEPGDQSFLFAGVAGLEAGSQESGTTSRFVVVENWLEELKARMER